MTGTVTPAFLSKLESRRAEVYAEAEQLLLKAKRAGRQTLTPEEESDFQVARATMKALDEHIADTRSELKRSGSYHFTGTTGGADATARAWSHDAVNALRRNLGGSEQRAVISGSVDVPSLVESEVIGFPFASRLLDLFTNRVMADSSAVEFYQQQAPRTNNATAVPDLAQKPTSIITVKAIQDRCRVVATLSEPVPLRIWTDEDAIVNWINVQLAGCVLDAVEKQAISGDGTGENMTGLLNTSGVAALPFDTDAITSLRHGVTWMQGLGETPTGWALNPVDAEAIDLTRWQSEGGFLSEGYATGVAPGNEPSSNNIFGTIPRVVSPSVPEGTALLGDWNQLRLYVREGVRIDVDGSGVLFETNAVKFRAEMRCVSAVLRPRAFAKIDLTA